MSVRVAPSVQFLLTEKTGAEEIRSTCSTSCLTREKGKIIKELKRREKKKKKKKGTVK